MSILLLSFNIAWLDVNLYGVNKTRIFYKTSDCIFDEGTITNYLLSKLFFDCIFNPDYIFYLYCFSSPICVHSIVDIYFILFLT